MVLSPVLWPIAAPFLFVWNAPSQPCNKHFGIDLNLTQYGLAVNDKEVFMGNRISLFYDLGVFPKSVLRSGTSVAVNGGIPQKGNLTSHLQTVDADIERLTSPEFAGVGVIDFESWRVDLEQNFGQLAIYRKESERLVRDQHPAWNKTAIQREALAQFNAAARLFFESTLERAKQLRPKASWGYYHYPYCFAHTTGQAVCAPSAVNGNNRTSWLFAKSDILLPSMYMNHKSQGTSVDRSHQTLAQLRETSRLNNNKRPVVPYVNLMYMDGGFLEPVSNNEVRGIWVSNEEDLVNSVGLAYDTGSAGVVLWGSSNIVNSEAKCRLLKDYVAQVLGPAMQYFRRRPVRRT